MLSYLKIFIVFYTIWYLFNKVKHRTFEMKRPPGRPFFRFTRINKKLFIIFVGNYLFVSSLWETVEILERIKKEGKVKGFKEFLPKGLQCYV